jgi:transposase
MGKVGRPIKRTAEAVVKDIRRQTRRKFGSEEKIRIVLEGLKGEESISEICRKEGIAPALYYRWSKDFIEAGKKAIQSVMLIPEKLKISRMNLRTLNWLSQSKLLKSECSKKACVV